MKRLPVYMMTAAIAMTGAASITSHAAVKVIAIGANGLNGNLSWKELAGNGFNGIKLPNCDIFNPNGSWNPGINQPATPDLDGSGLPDMEVPSVPDVDAPAVPDQDGSGLPDMEVPSVPDVDAPAVPDQDGSGLPDIGVPGQPSEEESNSSFTAQVAALVNEERAKAGLSALTVDSSVASAASVRAKEIVTSFSHTRPDGSSFSTALTQSGVQFQSAGENIAYGQRTPQEVMNGWMNSQGHKANILKKDFTTIGIGYYENESGVGYWTQLFTR